MPEESTTPDLVELARRSIEATSERDLDAIMAFYAPDAVWDASPLGIGTFEGQAAVRSFLEDWFASYEKWELHAEKLQDLGNEVALRYAAVAEDALEAAGLTE